MISRKTSLSENVVQFCRYLRQHDFGCGAEEEATALLALSITDHQRPVIFYSALKATLCRNKVQSDQFETHFSNYWKELRQALESKSKRKEEQVPAQKRNEETFKSLKSWLHGKRNNDLEETATYSHRETISQKDFSNVPGDEIDELITIVRALARRLAAKASRRQQASMRQVVFDLRRTMRKNLRRGGELLELSYAQPKQNRLKILLLCDVSRSMELYAAFMLQFMYAFQQVFSRLECFAFGTSLQRITGMLKDQHFRHTLQSLNTLTTDWSGGTRIGECLHELVMACSKKLIDHKTIVIIVSDGWDMGDSDLLKQSMRVIHQRAKKVIWLNPLAGDSSYRPIASGMRTALPFVDIFAPVHNVESLRQLGKWL